MSALPGLPIVSQFQGTLDVPIFVAPFSVTTPAYRSTVNQGTLNPRSDMPLMAEMYGNLSGITGYAGLLIPNSGYAVGMNYGGFNTFTINGGYNAATSNINQTTPTPVYLQSKLVFSYAWINQPTDFNSYAEIKTVPFYRNTDVGTLYPPFSAKNGVQTATSLPGSQVKHGQSWIGMPCALSGIFEFAPPIIAYLMPLGNNTQMAIIAPDVDNGLNPIDPGPHLPVVSGLSVISFQISFNLPKFVGAIPRNYMWGLDGGGGPGIQVMQWFSALAGTHSVMTIESVSTFSFDNPVLNATLNNHSAATTCFPIGLRGWLFSDIDNHADYFVDPTGTKYWKLNYLPQGNAKPVPYGQQETCKFVDFNGVFWYTGDATQNGHTITPQYSFGYSIPFNRFTLPNVPPMALPCYDDCLGHGVNITRRL